MLTRLDTMLDKFLNILHMCAKSEEAHGTKSFLTACISFPESRDYLMNGKLLYNRLLCAKKLPTDDLSYIYKFVLLAKQASLQWRSNVLIFSTSEEFPAECSCTKPKTKPYIKCIHRQLSVQIYATYTTSQLTVEVKCTYFSTFKEFPAECFCTKPITKPYITGIHRQLSAQMYTTCKTSQLTVVVKCTNSSTSVEFPVEYFSTKPKMKP